MDDWTQFRRDEAHTGWSPAPTRVPFSRAAEIRVDGPTRQYQADTITVCGDWVAVHGALAGGDPGMPHASTRVISEIDRAGRRITKTTSTLTHPLLIETSCGNWPILYGHRQWRMFESGLLTCLGARVLQRRSFDVYGLVGQRDDGSDWWQLSWEEWHKPSRMWLATSHATVWDWMQGVGTNTDDQNRPLGYCIQADGAYWQGRLLTNIVVGVKRPEVWLRDLEPQPPGTSGLALWDAETGALLAERPGQWGMIAVDAKRNRVWCARQDWRRDGEAVFDQFAGERGLGPSDALKAFSLPDLQPVLTCEGYSTPAVLQEPPLIGDDLVVWLTESGGQRMIVALDADTGEQVWATPVDPWLKRRSCPYYRQQFGTQLAASDRVIVYAGRGLTFIDVATGRVLQRVEGGLYYQPIFVRGELWVLRCYGNLLDERVARDGEACPDGFVPAAKGAEQFWLRYDSDPPPIYAAPRQHSAWHGGGYAVEVWAPFPAPQPSTGITVRGIVVTPRGQPVAGVEIAGATTGADGRYEVTGDVPLHLVPRKVGDTKGAVSSLDAARVLAAVAGKLKLTGLAKRAADVTGDGTVSSMDAARILALVTGRIGRLPGAERAASDWIFDPPTIEAQASLVVDFIAVPLGDVTGSAA